ncbi:ATP synthase mitochondrial F1 complex assembly factor 2 [Choanephora cucurbitarum]|uniref:ATP synthase mitochondrial F1 complex assembly factor 2 n=1 Tax=Choanephora cucurbitarum TaxID=101091 RepID=A0A1C7N020_9FUNG|nr:ATP synthase mitochondrial F1 complex assembly factor 2 [Choanephora cucurbitarum]
MSSFKLLTRPAAQWARSHRSIHTSAILRNAVEKEEAATQRAERTMTRFWKRAGIKEDADSVTVVLDQRNLRTPSKHIVKFPKERRQLALMTAAEWDAQTKNLKAHTLPLTSIVARSFDAFDPTLAEDPTVRSAVIDKLFTYFDTDSICYFEELPEVLTNLQDKYWKPIIDWTEKTYQVKINTTNDIFAVTQPEETKAKLRSVVEQMDPLGLASFEKAVMSSKSFLIGFALVHHGITVEQAAQAAHVEMNAQMERWGEVEDSHDVEREYIRQTLGSVAIAMMDKHQG